MRKLNHILSLVAVLCGLSALSSCTMITDDIKDCPTGLFVRFVYDYNIERADMFKDHVGHVTLYVYDAATGRKVAERSVSNTDTYAPLSQYGYTVHFDPTELPAGTYRLQAVAMQRDWDEALALDGAKYRRTSPEDHTSLQISLDHSDTPMADTDHHHVDHMNVPLDTLWHTLKVMAFEPQDGRTVPAMHRTSKPYTVYPLEDQHVTVADGFATYATVSMIRDTKHINLTLHQLDDKANIFASDYEVSIIADNETLDHDNAIAPGHLLHYSPYASWTSRFDSSGTTIEDDAIGMRSMETTLLSVVKTRDADDPDTERTAHFNLMTNRLMHSADAPNSNPRLRIVHKATGNVVADINLTGMLQEGRKAYDIYSYSPQEYLDRQHDYHLQIFLKGEKWRYAAITVNILGWAYRVDNVEL